MIDRLITVATAAMTVFALASALQCQEVPQNAHASAFKTEGGKMTAPYHYPPMEIPAEWGGNQEETRERILPENLSGNFADIAPGKNSIVLNLDGQDKNAKMHTVCVYPLLANPRSLFSGPGDPALTTGDVQRFGAPHRVLIEYGVGGSASESVFIDLRRGFKVAIPASFIKVTVFNVFDPAPFNTPQLVARGTISVAASIGEGNASDNDGISLTAVQLNVGAGATVNFPIPPHAKSFTIYAMTEAGLTGNFAAFNHQQIIDPPAGGGAENRIYDIATPAQKTPVTFDVVGDASYVSINGTAGVSTDIRVQWHLNL